MRSDPRYPLFLIAPEGDHEVEVQEKLLYVG